MHYYDVYEHENVFFNNIKYDKKTHIFDIIEKLHKWRGYYLETLIKIILGTALIQTKKYTKTVKLS